MRDFLNHVSVIKLKAWKVSSSYSLMASELYTKWNIIYRIINISVSSFNASCSLEHISHPTSCSLVSSSSPYSSSYSFSSSSFSLFSSFCSSSSSFFVYTTHQIQVVLSIMGNWNICTWWTQEMWTVGWKGYSQVLNPRIDCFLGWFIVKVFSHFAI